MSNVTVIGIDPGKKGGLAVIGGDQICTFQMPMLVAGGDVDVGKLSWIIKSYRPAVVYCEAAQHVRIGAGLMAKPTAVLFQIQGMIEGICATASMPLVIVAPRTWQAAIIGPAGRKSAEIKEAAMQSARRLFPAYTADMKSGDGRLDALLVAEYGRRQQNG
jgi:hypothetical protein